MPWGYSYLDEKSGHPTAVGRSQGHTHAELARQFGVSTITSTIT